jgi:hypothetical protein
MAARATDHERPLRQMQAWASVVNSGAMVRRSGCRGHRWRSDRSSPCSAGRAEYPTNGAVERFDAFEFAVA